MYLFGPKDIGEHLGRQRWSRSRRHECRGTIDGRSRCRMSIRRRWGACTCYRRSSLLTCEMPTRMATNRFKSPQQHNRHKSKKTCVTCSLAVCRFRMYDEDLFINDNAMILYGNNRTRTGQGCERIWHRAKLRAPMPRTSRQAN